MPELGVLATVKSELGIASGDTTFDTLITAYLNTAERVIAVRFGRKQDSEGTWWTVDGNITVTEPAIRLKRIRLNNCPVATIVYVREYTGYNTYTTVPATSYRLDSDMKTLRFSSSESVYWDMAKPHVYFGGRLDSLNVPSRTTNAYPYTEIQYTGGFPTNDGAGGYPYQLVQAFHDFAKQMFLSRDRDSDMKSETFGKYGYTLADTNAMLIADRVIATYLSGFGPPPI